MTPVVLDRVTHYEHQNEDNLIFFLTTLSVAHENLKSHVFWPVLFYVDRLFIRSTVSDTFC
jgi:hypothetical protein